MPKVILHKFGQTFTDEVGPNTNLVVRAGIRQFPYPNLRYECGMGKCSKCACRVIAGAEHLPPPNWKEKKQLGERLEQGYRLACQLWIEHDIELAQDDVPAAAPLAGASAGA
ncbi:putative Ferredoxin [Cupriavidus taiwanensis]|uniref:2Fe-2S iron-sulfur cluster-binding protein n=1 Tax=Cupriavidus taiwanensis TaxID=164546 RepID=UPI000E12004C|nr:2Fe-2S iron-sulfur cluster-binding protein [Cupriavidus taiwanensis]SOY93944.1 putative Ferredoxin [Cupriavidus taiwanensis]SOY99491.1 putative Ferredoxin [Cupriavidus taiwanensis]